ncbi:hypothetical protein J6590_039499 [Homalodisca vitripennis]|nr:hypothetical protein J6590_039499 [Homalodisca vitripennis]
MYDKSPATARSPYMRYSRNVVARQNHLTSQDDHDMFTVRCGSPHFPGRVDQTRDPWAHHILSAGRMWEYQDSGPAARLED